MATNNTNQQPQLTKSGNALYKSPFSALLKPNHRQLAIQYFFLSLALILFGLIVFTINTWLVAFNPELVKKVAFPAWFPDTHIISLSLCFGLFGLIFGALGNLITPLQLGAGEDFHIKTARGAWWCYLIGLISLIATIGPDGITPANHSQTLLTISGIALALSIIITGFHFIMIARLGKCNGMTVGRVPMAARVFIQFSALLILTGILGLVLPLFHQFNNDSNIANPWMGGFAFQSDRSFWTLTAYNLIGLSLFTLLALAFDAAAAWGRYPLRSRTIATLANSLGALSFFCWNIFRQFDSPLCNTTASVLFAIAGIAAVVTCFMLFASAIPKEFRPHPGLYFVWSIPVFFFLSFLDSSLMSRTVAILLPGIGAAIYYWYPRFRRRNLNQTVGRLHFYMTAIALLFLLLLPSIITNNEKQQSLAAVALMMLFAAQFPFIINTVASSFKYGNRIFIYPAILFIIELIANLFPNVNHGLIGWIWNDWSIHWLIKAGATLTTIAIMAFIDWRLLKAFPPKRKHPRPNRWVAIMTMASSIPLFLTPLILSNTILTLSTGWAWTIILASSIIGFAYSFKRGNRITFGDETIDNPWRANSLEWYERTPDQIEAGITAYETNQLTVYRHAYHYEKQGNGEDYLPQWVEAGTIENSTP